MNATPNRSILCPNCRKLISVDEPFCPFCRMAKPGSWLKNNPLTRGFNDAGRIVRGIILVNVGMFVLSVLLHPGSTEISANPLTLLSPASDSLLLLGATGTLPIDRLHRWWSLLSANYLHGGILHIALNMMAFSQLSPVVAREYGVYRFIVVYTLSGVTGFWVSYLAGVSFTIGASAAICGLMGALLYFGRSRGGVYGRIVYRQVGAWAVSLFVLGFLIPGINNWGHGGGMVGGALAGYLMGYTDKLPEGRLHRFLALGCVTATGLTLAWAAITGVLWRLLG